MSGNSATAGIEKGFLFVSAPQLDDEELSQQFGSSTNSLFFSQYILVDKSPGVSVGRKTRSGVGWDFLTRKDQEVLSCSKKRGDKSSNGKASGMPCPAQNDKEQLKLSHLSFTPASNYEGNQWVPPQTFQSSEVNLQNQPHKLHLGSLERRGVSSGVAAEQPEKLGEALCHSQTRARNAEKLATNVLVEKEQLAKLLFREASTCLTYKERVHLLELENSWLKMHAREGIPTYCNARESRSHCKFYKKGMSNGGSLLPGTIGLAFALGLTCASAGFMIGCCMGLFGFPHSCSEKVHV